MQDVETREPRDDAQHKKDEQQRGEIEGRDQPGQIGESADAVSADGEGHGAQRADGGDLHEDEDQLENGMAGRIEHMHQRVGLFPDQRQRDAEQDRDEQHLQDIMPVGDRGNQRVGDDVHQEARQRAGMGLLLIFRDLARVERGRIYVEARSGLHDVGDQQPHDQRQRRKGEEIRESLCSNPADRAHFLHARYARDDGQENDRRDDHLHQFDEGVAQRLERHPHMGPEMADEHAQRDGDQHLDIELPM